MLSAPNQCSADGPCRATPEKVLFGSLSGRRSANTALNTSSAVFADLLPLKDPNKTFSGVARQGPSAEHWFGADNIGHDVFARAIYGARRSLAVSVIATVIGMVI